MLADDVALLVQARRRGQRQAGRQGTGLAEDPGIADRAAGGRHAVDAGLGDHVETVLRREQVAAAQHGAGAGMALHFAQKLPAARADVALLNRAAVDRDRRHAARERAVEDREELVAAVRPYRPARGAF